MKKGFLVLSALALLACSACTIKVIPIPGDNSQPSSEQTSENPQGGSQGGTSQGGTSQGGTSQGGTSQGGGSQTSGHDGKSVATAYTVDELLANVNFTTTPSTEIYYVTGTCVATDEYVDATNHRYSYYFEGHTKSDAKPFQMYSGVFADTSKTPASLAGCTITFHGKAFIFQKDGQPDIYEIGYKKDVADNPVIDAISGESTTPTTSESQGGQTSESQGGGSSTTSNGIAGANAATTGSFEGASKISLDFTNDSLGNMPIGDTPLTQKATVNDIEYSLVNSTMHAKPSQGTVTTSYFVLYGKKAEKAASLANVTAINNIVGVEIVMPDGGSSVSDRAPIVVDFGTSALGATTLTGGQTGGPGITLRAYVASGFTASHFSISCVQGVSSTNKASWYNATISEINIYYAA